MTTFIGLSITFVLLAFAVFLLVGCTGDDIARALGLARRATAVPRCPRCNGPVCVCHLRW